jgi:hypothetical protein
LIYSYRLHPFIDMGSAREREESASTASLDIHPALRPTAGEKTTAVNEQGLLQQATTASDPEGQISPAVEEDVFGNEDQAEIQYKTCEWCK